MLTETINLIPLIVVMSGIWLLIIRLCSLIYGSKNRIKEYSFGVSLILSYVFVLSLFYEQG